MTLLSWDIPLISFNGSQWDVLLRCSKWLLGAWLDSFTMILRCWLVVWVKWARPLVSMTLWSRVMFNWKAVQLKGRPIHGPSYTIESQWGKFYPPAPRGATFTPFWGMVLQSLPASSNVANFTFLWNPLSELRGIKFFRNVKSMGQLWDAPAPQGCNFYPILRCGLTEPASLFKCGKFQTSVKSTLWATRRQSFSAMLSQCVWFCPYLPLGQTSYPRSLIKVIAHDPD